MRSCRRPNLCVLAALLIAGLLSACSGSRDPESGGTPPPEPGPLEFVGSTACAGCHAAAYKAWTGSHHDLAMQHATGDTVLGDFGNATFRYNDIESLFFERDGRYWVRTDNETGEMQEFEIRYAFGVAPLQQYLVEFPGGRLQTLPIAWDTRDVSDGGQRWFHIYPDEAITHDDPLHWTGRDQNWNYMCAECHSTNLEKNFDVAGQSFDTTWSEIDVGCEACHGPGSRHVALADAGRAGGRMGLEVDLDDAGRAVWQMNTETGIAERSELPMRPQQQAEACGRCHSRRSVITTDYRYGQPLLDTHMPALLDDNLYFPDGQIQDEVYVWGSFVQSRMYQAGVTCTDCHDPHTARLRTGGEASSICATCHLPERFASTEHHRHEAGQVACVDCHMPSRDYMVIDGRRDHSFRLPRPDLTLTTASPNACENCHASQGAAWAAEAIRNWYGDQRRPHYAEAIHAARSRGADANALLSDIVGDTSFPGIARATALSLIAPPLDAESAGAIQNGLANPDPLVRLGALRALSSEPVDLALRWVPPLLSDPLRAIRIEAARLLSPVGGDLPQDARAALERASIEYVSAQMAIAERPEAQANLASFFAARRDVPRAEAHFRLALRMEPRAVSARANLADFYRQLGREAEARAVLEEGLAIDDGSAPLHHSLGLLMVRGQEPEAALAELERAAVLDPSSPRYVYVYGVALNSLGRPDDAIRVLRDARRTFPTDFDIGWALATVLRDLGRTEEASSEAMRLSAQFPDNPAAASLVESLRAR